ncbi:MAG: hypothetical protein RSD49_16360 [Hafnia sp.]
MCNDTSDLHFQNLADGFITAMDDLNEARQALEKSREAVDTHTWQLTSGPLHDQLRVAKELVAFRIQRMIDARIEVYLKQGKE